MFWGDRDIRSSKVRYAAKDPLSGGAILNSSENILIKERRVEITQDDRALGNIQRVIRTEYVLRNLDMDRANRVLQYEKIDYREAFELGRRWFENGKLHKARVDGAPNSIL
jgi:hypothetical protein